ncbi:MAG: NAD(P)-dependent oxidoreductase [Acidobacteria bacterium]|nr:MAG: NAD(P)-dependent oxidoreductase [Acidobacteriota bacterium]
MGEPSVALIGLGTMGSGMATNLLKAGFPLKVYNRTVAKATPFASMGARIASTPAEAADGAEIIVTMLSDDDASREAWLGNGGALPAAAKSAILIESSTVSPTWISELARHASAHGVDLLDAPVTGSRLQADQGQLTFLVGGTEQALEKASPVLRAMSKDIVHIGPVGGGALMKLVNNFLSGVQIASFAEAMAWIERSGLDREKALNVLNNGAPGSPVLRTISARMVNRDYTVNFLLKLMAKDLAYATTEAAKAGITLDTALSATGLFQRAMQGGHGNQDMSSVVEVLRG